MATGTTISETERTSEREQVEAGADEQQAPRPVARDPDAGRHGGGLDAGQFARGCLVSGRGGTGTVASEACPGRRGCRARPTVCRRGGLRGSPAARAASDGAASRGHHRVLRDRGWLVARIG